eukprot:SAG31_NODE_3121_length_4653_cov_61.162934_2_plen_162_part_00
MTRRRETGVGDYGNTSATAKNSTLVEENSLAPVSSGDVLFMLGACCGHMSGRLIGPSGVSGSKGAWATVLKHPYIGLQRVLRGTHIKWQVALRILHGAPNVCKIGFRRFRRASRHRGARRRRSSHQSRRENHNQQQQGGRARAADGHSRLRPGRGEQPYWI